MNFFKKIIKSIYSPEFYSSILTSTLGSALKYFFLFVFLIELIFFAKLIPQLLLSTSGQIKNFVASFVEAYPKDLTVTVKSGEISTNVNEPYFIMDKEGKKFIVIDTKTPYSAAKFNDYSVAVWITKDTVFYKGDSQGQIKSQNLNQFPNVVVDKAFVASLGDKITPWIPYIGPILLVFMFLGMYTSYLFRLIYLFFLALLIWILSKLMKRGISYGQSYKVGIYTMTLAFLVDTVKSFFAWPGFPFMFTLISLAVFFVNFIALPVQKK